MFRIDSKENAFDSDISVFLLLILDLNTLKRKRNIEYEYAICIHTYIYCRYCGMSKPSWSELKQFVLFLNTQLIDYENCVFCSESAMDVLPGFYNFVLKFLILMSTVSTLDFIVHSFMNTYRMIPVFRIYSFRILWQSPIRNHCYLTMDH